jgi:hypothetical protein
VWGLACPGSSSPDVSLIGSEGSNEWMASPVSPEEASRGGISRRAFLASAPSTPASDFLFSPTAAYIYRVGPPLDESVLHQN